MNANSTHLPVFPAFFSAALFFSGACFWAPSVQAAHSTDAPLQQTDAMTAQTAAWRPSAAADVKLQALAWLKSQKPAGTLLAQADAVWADLPADAADDNLLLRLAKTFALANPNAEKLLVLCREAQTQPVVPNQAWLREKDVPPLLAANMRLFFAGWLIHESRFDEAAEQLSDISPADVAAPATLLFYQSVVYHAMLNKESGLKSIDRLLQGADAAPRRYVVLAQMMQDDLQGLAPDTLDYIIHYMSDVRRRLDLGQAGPKVRRVEDDIIKSFDKMIKKLEEEQQQQKSMEFQPNQGGKADRLPTGTRYAGLATKKNTGSESGWGDLPPKEREEALQQIGREFPSQYHDAILEYFRRLAAEKEQE